MLMAMMTMTMTMMTIKITVIITIFFFHLNVSLFHCVQSYMLETNRFTSLINLLCLLLLFVYCRCFVYCVYLAHACRRINIVKSLITLR